MRFETERRHPRRGSADTAKQGGSGANAALNGLPLHRLHRRLRLQPHYLAAADPPAEPIPPSPTKPIAVAVPPPEPKPDIEPAEADEAQAIEVAALGAEEVAAAILYLCGPESSYITGAEIPVNGGQDVY